MTASTTAERAARLASLRQRAAENWDDRDDPTVLSLLTVLDREIALTEAALAGEGT